MQRFVARIYGMLPAMGSPFIPNPEGTKKCHGGCRGIFVNDSVFSRRLFHVVFSWDEQYRDFDAAGHLLGGTPYHDAL